MQFWHDFNKCANLNRDNEIVNLINMSTNNSKPRYFEIFNCNEYKITWHKHKIEFDPNDIEYPYNKNYMIKKVDNVIKIKMYD